RQRACLCAAGTVPLAPPSPVPRPVATSPPAPNVSPALKLSRARAALPTASARNHAPAFQYAPRLVKKALVGYGNAEKPQVRSMVLSLLARQRARVPLDAADALAVAICHVHANGGR